MVNRMHQKKDFVRTVPSIRDRNYQLVLWDWEELHRPLRPRCCHLLSRRHHLFLLRQGRRRSRSRGSYPSQSAGPVASVQLRL